MKILVIEDDEKIALLIKKGLENKDFHIDIAYTGEEGLKKALEGSYGLLILDIMLPQRDGFSLLKELRAHGLEIPILILSARRAVEDRVRGLQLGSDDYLVKPFAMEELVARVQALLRRSPPSREVLLRVADLELDLLRRQARRGGREIELSNKEFQLLKYLMQHRGQILTRSQILSQVWGYRFDPSTNIVEVHICRLREKVDKGFEKKLIHTVRGAGYVFKD